MRYQTALHRGIDYICHRAAGMSIVFDTVAAKLDAAQLALGCAIGARLVAVAGICHTRPGDDVVCTTADLVFGHGSVSPNVALLGWSRNVLDLNLIPNSAGLAQLNTSGQRTLAGCTLVTLGLASISLASGVALAEGVFTQDAVARVDVERSPAAFERLETVIAHPDLSVTDLCTNGDIVVEMIADVLLDGIGNPEMLGDLAVNIVPGTTNPAAQETHQRCEVLVQLLAAIMANVRSTHALLANHHVWINGAAPVGSTAVVSWTPGTLNDDLAHISSHDVTFLFAGS